MKNENLIHIKLEYEEAIQSKKEILSSEMDLLKIARTIKKYHSARLEELKQKSRLHRKIKETITNIRKLQTILPKSQSPLILPEDKDIPLKTKTKKNPEQDNLEYQLQEIQDKLKSLAA